MVFEILSKEKGKKIVLLGNEAIVRGALEAGVKFATTYPGTPASEIGDTFARIAKQANIYFEYSINEKVALEAAAGASFSGLRAIVSFKQFGLNVASDSFMPIAYIGAKGLVIVNADDPGCLSSAQSEQDNRYYARIAHIPMLEPSNVQECKEMVKFAFELSEKFEIPVLIRLTTRVSLQRGVVELGEIKESKKVPKFVKNLKKFNTMPPRTIEMHKEILEKIDKIKEISENTIFNFVLNEAKSKFGIITSGVSFNYVLSSLKILDLKIPVLKLGLTYPLPERKIENFLKKLNVLLVVEELEPLLEEEIKRIAKNANPKLKIFGKNILPKYGEYRVENVLNAISKTTGKKLKIDLEKHFQEFKKIKIPIRYPILCPGCPHRAVFYAVKKACKDCIFGGDIGCYALGSYAPLFTQDFLISMGASIGTIHGIKKSTNQKSIAFIGDSTFFHAGIPGILNLVYNNSSPLVIVLDNLYTAMTGHQPNPSTGYNVMEKTKEIKIEEIAKSLGIKNLVIIDPFNLDETIKAIKDFVEKNEASLIVARRECQLVALRRKRREGIKIPKFRIIQEKCDRCGLCLYEFGCPAFYKENGNFFVNEDICTGCAVCTQVCPKKAIVSD